MKSINFSLLSIALLCWISMANLVNAQDTTDTADEKVVVQHVNPVEAAKLIEEHPDYVILDVRTPIEFKNSNIENAININYYSFSFKKNIAKLDKDKTYIVHCQSGVRSGKTMPIMLRAGFKNLIHMDGGMKGWKHAKLPVE